MFLPSEQACRKTFEQFFLLPGKIRKGLNRAKMLPDVLFSASFLVTSAFHCLGAILQPYKL